MAANDLDHPNGHANTKTASGGGTLGTFTGVFTPSILTILGIILFLRLGYVVGQGGLANSLVIIAIATAVSVLTSISLAAIATNITVKGGGDYYLISRTLGVEFGGAIGIVLFLAQSVSIAFYAIGFGEAVAAMVGVNGAIAQLIAAGAVFALFALAWAGADIATRFQFVVMAALIAALASFFIGATGRVDGSLLASNWTVDSRQLGFWTIFAIFFPAVTGFTQGVSMSGDLKDPGRSLPLGTFAAVGLSTIVYVAVAILLAATADGDALRAQTGALGAVSVYPPLIDAGVIAATLSSAMASFLGAPRILQSLATDKVFPILNPFARGAGPTANPRRGVLLSLAIALATILLGELNVIAPVVSMFFLISYGLINYATYYEARASSPSFRPRFRYFDKRLSLAGAVGCLGVMLAINPAAGGLAVVVLLGIHRYVRRNRQPERWADAAHAHYFSRAIENVRLLSAEQTHARNWRPQIVAFSASPDRRARLMRFASWIEGGSGLTAIVQVISGEGALKRRERDVEQARLEDEIEALDIEVFPLAVLAPDTLEALPIIVQSFGIGALRANTVLFGWPEHPSADARQSFFQTVTDNIRNGLNVVCMSSDAVRWNLTEELEPDSRSIDVWWNDDDSSRLALLAAYLCTRTRPWEDATLRLLSPTPDGSTPAEVEARLTAVLEEARIDAEPVAIPAAYPTAVAGESATAALVLLPARMRRGEAITLFDQPLEALMARLPLSAAFFAGAPLDLSAGPDTGHHTLLAVAEERVDAAENRLRTLQHQFEQAESELGVLVRKSQENGGVDEDVLREAEVHVARLERRRLKAQASVELAKQDVAKLLAER